MSASFEPKKQQQTQQKSSRESQGAISYPSQVLVHAKLEMTDPGDADEREADAAADELVSSGKIARKISDGGRADSGIAVPRQMESRLEQLRGGGMTMPSSLRSQMEGGFGQGFPNVRLHVDSEAARLSESIGARAFTHGSDIYFNRGQYAPDTAAGQRLLAHELTHVVQGGGRVARLTEDQRAAQSKKQHKVMDEIKSEYFAKNRFIVDDDGGRTLCDLMKRLPEPYFYQLLCTNVTSFQQFLCVGSENVLYDLVVEFRFSFKRMIQSSRALYRKLIGEKDDVSYLMWETITQRIYEKGYKDDMSNVPIASLMHLTQTYGPYKENGKDSGMKLTSDKYHENRITALEDYAFGDYYNEYNYFDPAELIPKLMNLNSQDFLAFIYKCVRTGQFDLLYSITTGGAVPGVKDLWMHHNWVFQKLMYDKTVFSQVFSPEALASLGREMAEQYQDHIARLERQQQGEAAGGVQAARDAVLKEIPEKVTIKDVLDIFGTIINFLDKGNGVYAIKGSLGTINDLSSWSKELTKMADGLKFTFGTLSEGVKNYLVDNAKTTSSFGKASAWYGVFAAAVDLLSTMYQYMRYDINDFPIAVSAIILGKFACLASAILNLPSLLARIAAANPAVGTGIVFFGVGLTLGDWANKTFKEVTGKTPAELLVDVFMD